MNERSLFSEKQQTRPCAVCGQPDQKLNGNLNQFNYVCDEHKQYANWFQIDIARVKLGFQSELPDACCAICDNQLSQMELYSVHPQDFIKTCTSHRWMSKFFVFQEFKEQYKAGLPFTYAGKIYSEKNPMGITA